MFLRKTAWLAGLCLCLTQAASAAEPRLGAKARALSRLEYVDGSALNLDALRGKPTVLYFGADWCEPCRNKGRPTVTAVAKKYQPKGLQVVFISLDDNNFRAAKVQEAKTISIPIAMAKLDICPPGSCIGGLREQGEFGRIHVFPTAYVLDSGGVIRAILKGGNGVQEGLEKAVTNVLTP